MECVPEYRKRAGDYGGMKYDRCVSAVTWGVRGRDVYASMGCMRVITRMGVWFRVPCCCARFLLLCECYFTCMRHRTCLCIYPIADSENTSLHVSPLFSPPPPMPHWMPFPWLPSCTRSFLFRTWAEPWASRKQTCVAATDWSVVCVRATLYV